MRFHKATRSRPATRGIGAGVPVMVVGSIALALGASPAAAAEPVRHSDKTRTIGIRPAVAVPPTYIVQQGDTVSAIAARFGLRTTDVLALNGLGWSTIIRPGQALKLVGTTGTVTPAPKPAPAKPAAVSHVVRAGDTISAIAKKHGVSIQAVLTANGLGWSSIIYPGQKIAVPGATAPAKPAPAKPATPAASHIVIAGDTISGIAQKYGVTVQAVLNANGLGWSSIIYPGQKIALPSTATTAKAAVAGLDAEQAGNAKLIIQVGRQLGVPDRGIAIALGTAMQESWLRNLDWGDRDSLGLFQQRPSTGWGTAAEVRDPVRATKVFFGGPGDPNGSRTRGLLDINGWQSMSFAQAAQAVQISAFPDRYARWETPAYAWLAALG